MKSSQRETNLSRRSLVRGALSLAALAPLSMLATGCSAADGSSAQAASSADDAAGSAQPDGGASAGAAASGGSVLVAYYSATGNTERVAQVLADHLGADLFAITPAEPYAREDLNYSDDESRVSREYADESLRTVELAQVTPDGFDGYDTVLIGYPIWWGIAAWPTDGFVSGNDFTGKTVIPFCTSASSPLGESGDNLAALAGTGDWQEGERFSGGVSDDDVAAWADTLAL